MQRSLCTTGTHSATAPANPTKLAHVARKVRTRDGGHAVNWRPSRTGTGARACSLCSQAPPLPRGPRAAPHIKLLCASAPPASGLSLPADTAASSGAPCAPPLPTRTEKDAAAARLVSAPKQRGYSVGGGCCAAPCLAVLYEAPSSDPTPTRMTKKGNEGGLALHDGSTSDRAPQQTGTCARARTPAQYRAPRPQKGARVAPTRASARPQWLNHPADSPLATQAPSVAPGHRAWVLRAALQRQRRPPPLLQQRKTFPEAAAAR